MLKPKTTTLLAAATAVAASLAIFAGPGTGSSGLAISTCGQLATTNAFLTKDLDCPGSGIVIGASGITIDLKGHTLKGPDLFANYGILDAGGYDHVTIKNGFVRDFEQGVRAAGGADNVSVTQVVASANLVAGFYVSGASASINSSTAAANRSDGMYVTGAGTSIKSSSSVGNGNEGFYVVGSAASIKSSTASGNGGEGFYLPTGTAASIKSST